MMKSHIFRLFTRNMSGHVMVCQIVNLSCLNWSSMKNSSSSKWNTSQAFMLGRIFIGQYLQIKSCQKVWPEIYHGLIQVSKNVKWAKIYLLIPWTTPPPHFKFRKYPSPSLTTTTTTLHLHVACSSTIVWIIPWIKEYIAWIIPP